MKHIAFIIFALLPVTCTPATWAAMPPGWPTKVHCVITAATGDLSGVSAEGWIFAADDSFEGMVGPYFVTLSVAGNVIDVANIDVFGDAAGLQHGEGNLADSAWYWPGYYYLNVDGADWGWLSTPEGFFEAWCYGAGCAIAWCLLLAVCPRLVIDGSLLLPRSG